MQKQSQSSLMIKRLLFLLSAATLQVLLSMMFVQAVKNTDIKTEHSKLTRNEYTK